MGYRLLLIGRPDQGSGRLFEKLELVEEVATDTFVPGMQEAQ